MDENFKLEIISPEKIIFSETVQMVKVPSYEGDMSLLKDHISIITFLRPGIIKVQKSNNSFEEFFTQDGTVEFFNNTLVLLSTSTINIKKLSKEFLENLKNDIQNMLAEAKISDQDKYILNHQLDTIKEIRI